MPPDAVPLSETRPLAALWLRRRRPWLVTAVLLLSGVVLIAWTQRRPIARAVIDRKLAEWHVPARYKIADLGLNRQRLTHVVLGDPAHPDLVADWVSIDTSLGLSGAQVVGVRAGHVRMRGRLVNGTLSLGALDRLLPASSGKAFALPTINLTADDVRMRLETSQEVIGLKLIGSGRLNDGFRGTLAAVSERLQSGACRADRLAAVVDIRVTAGQPHLLGPVRAGSIDCAGAHVTGVVVEQTTTFGSALDRWQGSARVAFARLPHRLVQIGDLAGQISYAGSARQTRGTLDVSAAEIRSDQARAVRTRITGSYRLGVAGGGFDGTMSARMALGNRWEQALARLGDAAPGTPIAPLLARFATASASAARDATISARLALSLSTTSGSLAVSDVQARSASGAIMALNSGTGIGYNWPKGKMQVDGTLALAGGGLPDLALRLRQSRDGGVTGSGVLRPYPAGTARLAIDAIDFAALPGGITRFAASVALSGPLGGGRVDNARLPITGMWDGRNRLTINPACAPLRVDRLIVSGLDLRPSRFTLCPDGGALLAWSGGAISGGGHVDGVNLAGTLGGTPVTLAARHADLTLADMAFTLSGVAARLDAGTRLTRLDMTTLSGKVAHGSIAGRLAGGAGQIANVPLLLSGAAGDWNVRDGRLTVNGSLIVADANDTPRFEPLDARGVVLTLADNRLAATGALHNPATGVRITDVSIVHDLSSGAGRADLAVPGLSFGAGLKPGQLTRLTQGVIADVNGTVSGDGHIRWTHNGVTSDGVFRASKVDLAALFGPVKGLSTEIHFTDLLNMVSAPGQVATVAIVNPGVAVENGVVHYRLLANQKVDVTGAEWPFAGGRLVLEPSLLDFTENQERHLTFRVEGTDAAQFLQQFDFKNLDATGTFDGTLPMIFSDRGGRIEGGHLKVRPGGGTIAYVGEISQKDLGFWGNVAFQALKALSYRRLEIDMNGPLDGEVITDVRFDGVRQGKGAKSNFVIKRIARLPLVFNVRIQAPFRQLLDSAQGFYDPSRLIRRNLPALIRAQQDAQTRSDTPLPQPARPIQPPESEKRP
jgi:hypothetical protein